MAALSLICTLCGFKSEIGPLVYGCPACAERGIRGQLEVAYSDLPEAVEPQPDSPSPMWGYHEFLPVESGSRLSLGEGGTPLVRGAATSSWLDLPELYFKNESANPTWSFKDRYDAVTISMAKQMGFRRVVVSSTGNHGAAVAAYAARGGMESLVLCPPEVSRVLVSQISLYGAHTVITDWNGRSRLVEHLARERGWFPVGLFMPFPISNPYGIEGYKTIAFEVYRQLGRAPDAFLFPCARGNGLYGTWKGFEVLRAANLIARMPRMYACQPAGANPLERSFEAGLNYVLEVPAAASVATSVRETTADANALRAVVASGGRAISATDDALLDAVRRLGRDGLCVEPASALPLACLAKLRATGEIRRTDTVVCLVTAAGIKWPEQLTDIAPARVHTIDPSPEAMDDLLARLDLENR